MDYRILKWNNACCTWTIIVIIQILSQISKLGGLRKYKNVFTLCHLVLSNLMWTGLNSPSQVLKACQRHWAKHLRLINVSTKCLNCSWISLYTNKGSKFPVLGNVIEKTEVECYATQSQPMKTYFMLKVSIKWKCTISKCILLWTSKPCMFNFLAHNFSLLLQSFRPFKPNPFLTIDCKPAFRSISIQSTTN